MDSRGLRVTQNAYFLLLTYTKQLLLVTFCNPTAEIGSGMQCHDTMDAVWKDKREGWSSCVDLLEKYLWSWYFLEVLTYTTVRLGAGKDVAM